MAGRRTYLAPHPGGHRHVEAAWIGQLKIDPQLWRMIDTALGRQLTIEERQHITSVAEWHAAVIRNNLEARVSAQDIKETLRGLASMPVAEVQKQLKRADGWSQAEIDTALWQRHHIFSWDATAEQIREAAASRISKVTGRPGRRADTALFAAAIIALWQQLGGARTAKPAARESRNTAERFYANPITNFGAALFAAAGVPGDKPAIAARLQKALKATSER